MEKILESINDAAKGAFPNSVPKYKKVSALLLSWKDDDLGIEDDVEELKTLLETGYGYHVERWQIPSVKPDFELTDRLRRFRIDHETEKQGDCLFIVYYAGHGYLDRTRRTMWSCRACSSEQPEPARVKWHAHEALFTETIHDTLFLFDCCTAGSSSETTRIGIKEVIAACGFETWAPGDREHSFTKALINVLRSMVRARPFTVASLHQQILETLKHWSPHIEPDQLLQIGSDGRLSDIERRRTPVHIALNQEPYYYHSSIQLVGYLSEAAASYKRTEESIAQWQDGQEEYTDVIISIRVQGKLEVAQFASWIMSVPLLVMSIKVHCVVHKDPTLVLLAVPVAVWDLLPADTPCHFIGYANSPNLIFGRENYFTPEGQYLWPYPQHMLRFEDTLKRNAEHPDMIQVQEWLYDDYFLQLSKLEPDSPHVKYAIGMQKFRIGHALLEPESPEAVSLGAYGYLGYGKWHPIELSDMPRSRKPGTSGRLDPRPKGSGSFQRSSSQKDKYYAYRLENGWGVLLLPSRPIIYESIETDELLTWAYSNAQIILTTYPNVKEYGFYLISGIHKTEDFQIITRDAQASAASEPFFVTLSGQSNDNLSWSCTGGDGNAVVKEYQDEAVISFHGFYFTYKKILTQYATTKNVVEEQSDADKQRSLYEFQHTPFIWQGDRSGWVW